MLKKPPKRSRAHDILLELAIALGIVAFALLAAFFYANYENASWMPSPDAMKQGAWTVAAIGFGCAYLYLAYSTRRLQRLVADKPQLQPLMAVMDKWYIDGAIGIACLLVAVALWWRVIGEHIMVPAIIQLVIGVVFVLGGIAVLRVGAKLRSRPTASRRLADALTGYVLPIAAILYGAARFGSGIYLLLK